MKHSLKITMILVCVFLVSQIVGLGIINEYIDHKRSEQLGKPVFEQLPYKIERPPMKESTSYIYIMAAVLIGTVLVLILIKYRQVGLWKLWFFIGVTACLAIAFTPFIKQIPALIVALILSFLKVYRPNVFVHNISEIFLYGGLAAIFVPLINLFSIFMLLLLLSVYDMIAVWKIKHMVTMAKFQTKEKLFAGILIPYKLAKQKKIKGAAKVVGVKKIKNAVLGGGDIGFPLLFGGVVMKGLMMENSVFVGFLKALIIPVFCAIALFGLLYAAEKDKFYPAIPFLSAGCVAGYGVLLLINMI